MRTVLPLVHDIHAATPGLPWAGLGEVAATVERLGFDAVYVTDHPFPHPDYEAHGGHHSLDPFVALTAAACATSTLLLQTLVLVMPYRDPFITAKAAATVDLVSGGRLMLGLGSGYQEQELAAFGVAAEGRLELTARRLELMTLAWSGEPVHIEQPDLHIAGNVMLPRPVQLPHPPLWIGGNSRAAIRLAVDAGQGWVPFINPAAGKSARRTSQLDSLDALAGRIEYLREYASARGRSEPVEIAFSLPLRDSAAGKPLSASEIVDTVGNLGALGVSWVRMRPDHYMQPASGCPGYLDQIEKIGADLLPLIRPIR